MKRFDFRPGIFAVLAAALLLAGCSLLPATPITAEPPATPTAAALPRFTARPLPTRPATGPPLAAPSATPLLTSSAPALPGAAAPLPFTALPLPTEPAMANPTSAPLPQDPGLRRLIETARQDLANRLGVSTGEIVFVQFEPVVWPDGSLGCPRPGMLYPQVQVDGYRIRLEYAGEIYAYHGGGSRAPFLCEQKTP